MFKSNWKIYFALMVFFILLSSGRGLLARAAIIEKIELENKKIKITGTCSSGVLNVQIFSATSSQPFYFAGADCHENKFEFKDDLGYWQIPDGDYSVVIMDEDDSSVNSSTVMFKIQSVVPPASDDNIVESIVDLENNSSSLQENEASKIEIANQGEAPDGLFAQIINFLMEWFKSAVVLIKELVVEKVSTPELCLGSTCIVEDQLRDLLGGKQKIEAFALEPEIQTSTPSSISEATTTPVN